MPRKKKPVDNAARVANHRARIEAEGGRQIAVMLNADATAKLEAWTAKGETKTEVINRLLTRSKP